jgi:hypothetical protein
MPEHATRKVVLARITGSPYCVSIEDGNKVHEQIAAAFDRDEPVEVSFDGVRRLTTAFLNAAIGQLYNEYDEAKIRSLISLLDASQEDLRLLTRVVDNAKKFFRDPARYRTIMKDALGDDE